jgi:hypothetical protein
MPVCGLLRMGDNREQGQAYYDATVALCDRLDLAPSLLSVTRVGRSKRDASFQAGDRRLKREGFEGVEDFTLAVCPWDPGAMMLTADLECDWSQHEWAILVVRSVLTNLDDPRFRLWLRESVVALRPEYAIAYYRTRRLGSALYVIGLGFDYLGEPPQETREAIRRCKRWGSDGLDEAVWRQGILRDVYPLHILTRPQLDRRVGPVPLCEWITQEPWRGSLANSSKAGGSGRFPTKGPSGYGRLSWRPGASLNPRPKTRTTESRSRLLLGRREPERPYLRPVDGYRRDSPPLRGQRKRVLASRNIQGLVGDRNGAQDVGLEASRRGPLKFRRIDLECHFYLLSGIGIEVPLVVLFVPDPLETVMLRDGGDLDRPPDRW